MAVNPRSIRVCFDDPLPQYEYDGGKYTADEGGRSTNLTEPPIYAIPRNNTITINNTNVNNRWADHGQNFLTTRLPQCIADLQNSLQKMLNAKSITQQQAQQKLQEARAGLQAIEREFIHHKEGAIFHGNESDIVRTAAMYLIHPVSQVLWAHAGYRDGFCNQSEHTFGNKATGTVRADLTFSKCVIPNVPSRVFAVVEFKRRTIIRSTDFGGALRANPWPQGYDDRDPNHRQQAQQIANSLRSTTFKEGSYWLIKQASSYAIKYRTRYVALYDYDFLICCYFPQIDPSKTSAQLNTAGVGKFVELDIYPFFDQNGRNISRDMRLALLGFLESALTETPP